ncbi:tricarboxylate transport protein, mitochondrial-like isoform X1 [Anastrepha ludens]|uniref:tricarboxylate transport protein, mitochondrial-like isoform X1 n=1 Tax=Anastrepha ludens TaxID=28586 RepID=UPI0023B20257|nr:tricarboxylate transport protein, mitochondrial-like isoform X1 [Anastrepha ludens]
MSDTGWKYVLCGGMAGGTEVLITFPTDYVKTQLQLDEKGDKKKYSGVFDCFRKTTKQYGFFGLYRGMSALLYGSIPKTAVCFGSFEYFKSYLVDENKILSTYNSFLCGFASGIIESIVVTTPMETLKVKLINDRRSEKPRFHGFFHAARVILKTEGFRGIYMGLTPTLLRQCSNHAIRFPVMETFKNYYKGDDPTRKPPKWLVAVVGLIAGGSAVLVNTPVDTLKTRMQGLEAAKYENILDCALKIYRNEGVLAFYKGMIPRFVRLSLQACCIFTLYDVYTEAFDEIENFSRGNKIKS